MAHRPDPAEPFWGHWAGRGDDTPPQAQPRPQAQATPPRHWGWLSSRWLGGCLAAAAALALALGIWAPLAPGPTHALTAAQPVTRRASTVTSVLRQPVTHVVTHAVTKHAPPPPPVTEWVTAAAPPAVTVTVTASRATVTASAPGATVTVTVPTTVTVTVTIPPAGSLRSPAAPG